MIALDALWNRELPAGLYRFALRRHAAHFCEQAAERGFRCFYLDGLKIDDKQSFLRACAAAMSFPDYFGHNWDALADSMADLTWAPATSYILFFDRADPFAAGHPHDWKIARSILAETVEAWDKRGVAFYVLLRGAAATSGLPRFP